MSIDLRVSVPTPLIQADPQQAAEEAGLRYTSDEQPGFHRRRRGKGFIYLDSRGEVVSDPRVKERLESLVIPPAWTEVWICKDKKGHLQATGRDEKGRKQYIYHPDWEAQRNLTKFSRLPAFADALPALRARIDEDLHQRGFPREKVLAILVRLLDRTLIRIGNPEYARLNQSYGLTTLENEHFEVRGSSLIFAFRGKSGKNQEIEVRDRRMAAVMARLQELPGQRLFQYQDDGGSPQTVDSGDVNAYLREICGSEFSAKDFRTWGATVIAGLDLYLAGPADTKTERKRRITTSVKRAAGILGNTPAVSRQYYIHPKVFSAYEDGSLFTAFQKAALQAEDSEFGLDLGERAVRLLLQEESPGL